MLEEWVCTPFLADPSGIQSSSGPGSTLTWSRTLTFGLTSGDLPLRKSETIVNLEEKLISREPDSGIGEPAECPASFSLGK